FPDVLTVADAFNDGCREKHTVLVSTSPIRRSQFPCLTNTANIPNNQFSVDACTARPRISTSVVSSAASRRLTTSMTPLSASSSSCPFSYLAHSFLCTWSCGSLSPLVTKHSHRSQSAL